MAEKLCGEHGTRQGNVSHQGWCYACCFRRQCR